jgi:hypothetical protein
LRKTISLPAALSCAAQLTAWHASTSWAQKVMPVAGSGSTFTLSTGGTSLQVGTADGGRIASLKYQGAEMLRTKSMVSGNDLLWGSTLWPSPQFHWTASCKSAVNTNCWPPPAALDPNAYSGGLVAADTALTYTGGADSYTGLRIRKTFAAHLGDSSFTNRYHLVNTTGSAITWAPWETTRFPSGGMAFWPTGEGAVTGNAAMVQRTRDTLGVTWFTYDSAMSFAGTAKIFADGGSAGWMARLDKNRILFIKKFADTPPAKRATNNENEIEIYVTRDLLEFEVQGAYNPIPANDSVGWDVKWFVRKLPDSIAVSRNAALVAFVNKVITGATVSVQVPRGSGASGPSFRSSGAAAKNRGWLGRGRDRHDARGRKTPAAGTMPLKQNP